MLDVIINSPSLDLTKNVSGISSVVQFIIDHNTRSHYIHFEVGRTDEAKGGLSRLFDIVCSLRNWKRLLQKYPEAIVHFNFAMLKRCIIRDSVYLLFCKKHKLVVHIHGGSYLFSDDIPFYLNILLKRLFSKNIPFILLSDIEKQRIEEKYHPKSVYSLPNCIDLNDAAQFVRVDINDVLTLGYIGRVSGPKGMNELLEACVTLKNEGFPFKLVIAGSEREGDTYLSRYAERLGDEFEYVGIVSGEAKTNFLKAIDVFVLPSYFEGLPISLLETMGFGCVPVTTNVGSVGTVVRDNENGLLIRVKSSVDIVNQVKRLKTENGLYERLSRNARQTIFSSFDPNTYMEKLQSIYQSLS